MKTFSVRIEHPGGRHVCHVQAEGLTKAYDVIMRRITSDGYTHIAEDDDGVPFLVWIPKPHITRVSIKECQ